MKATMQRCKIVASLGPACANETSVAELIENGVDAFRINSAHAGPDDILAYTRLVRQTARRMGRHIAVLQDLAGPKIRCGRLATPNLSIQTGTNVTLTLAKTTETATEIPIAYKPLFRDLAAGDKILLADGTIELEVTDTGQKRAACRVVQGGLLRSGQGINVPSVQLSAGAITQEDEAALRAGLEAGVDFFSVSFVQTADDMRKVRSLVADAKTAPALIAKIERPQAVAEIDRILDHADGIMVARGDLGVEVDIAEMPAIQKRIIRRANSRGRFVITATQMLESMTAKTYPTRAEATDVANAVWDGSDALMLSGETAIGAHPALAVRMMTRIIAAAEREEIYRGPTLDKTAPITALAHAAAEAARDVGARAILSFTHSGATAARISQQRPSPPVFAATPDERVARSLALYWGVETFLTPVQSDTANQIAAAEKALTAHKWVQDGDLVILVTGSTVVRGLDYTVKILRVGSADPARFHDTLTKDDFLA